MATDHQLSQLCQRFASVLAIWQELHGKTGQAPIHGLGVVPGGCSGMRQRSLSQNQAKPLFFFLFFLHGPPGCAAPASLDLAILCPEAWLHGRASRAAPCLQRGKPAPQPKEPRASWEGEAATCTGDTARTCWVPSLTAKGWRWGKYMAQKAEPRGLERISKRWEDVGREQERAEGLAGAGSRQAAHATDQGLARHRLAPALAIWSSNHPTCRFSPLKGIRVPAVIRQGR